MCVLFIAPPTVDANFEPIAGQPWDSPKMTCEIDFRIGGGGANALRAFSSLSPVPAQFIPVVGDNDALSRLALSLLEAEFGAVQSAIAAAAGRLSAITPDPNKSGAYRAHTNRPGVDAVKLTASVKKALSKISAKRVFLGGLSDTPTLTLLARMAHHFGAGVYILPTSDQLKRQSEFLALLRNLEPGDWVQMNRQESETLTKIAGVVEGIRWLRGQGCPGSLLVTDSANGSYAWSAIDGNWFHAKAFDVPVVCDLTAGDTLGGTILAWLETPDGADLSRGLRLASAVAARQVARMPRAASWRELETWARETPEKVICEPVLRLRDRLETALVRFAPNRDFVSGSLATAAAFATLMLTLFYTGAAT